jgi:hypothetical protein
MNKTDSYGLRLVNPYTGVLQVANLGSGRALSKDGYHWELQVKLERRKGGWGSLNRQQSELNYYRCASWNPEQGLRQMPIDPSIDRTRLSEAVAFIVSQLRSELIQRLPLPLKDRFELWLLDTEHLPLALLACTVDRELIPQIREQRWRAFSPALPLTGYSRSQAEPLERQIRQISGHRQWFERRAEGSGIGLEYLCPGDLIGRELSAECFPPLLVRKTWKEPEERDRIQEWSASLAPWLLELPGLDDADRARLELAASRFPALVDGLHRLYPRIIDSQWLNTIRVAAKIETANG